MFPGWKEYEIKESVKLVNNVDVHFHFIQINSKLEEIKNSDLKLNSGYDYL